jgi:integrase
MASKHTAARLHLLTARQVQAAVDGDHSDGGGLLLRVRSERVSKKSGATLPAADSWVFRYTSPTGTRREMGLGLNRRGSVVQAGESLTGARDAAHKARELLRQGLDPISERDGRREAGRQAEAAQKAVKTRERWTLARVARDYHERVIEPTRTTKHAAQWISSLENHIPATLWHKPIADIEPPELLSVLSAIKPHERARNLTADSRVAETVQRIRQRLDAVFEDAIFHKRCTSNPAAAVRRKMRESMPRKEAGEFAALPYREAPAFMQRLREAQGTAARCLEFAMLTTARTSEALQAVWPEIDFAALTWVLPAERMKAKEAHVVHLSARAVEILRGQAGLHASLVFPSTMKADSAQSNMAMLAVLDRLGVRGQTTVHGLCRATFSTWANETAAARPDVIEACLAHEESNRVRAAYNRAKFNDERRALLEAWAAYLSQPPALVLPFERAA